MAGRRHRGGRRTHRRRDRRSDRPLRRRPRRPSSSEPTARRRRSSATRTRSASGCSSRCRASTRTATASTDRIAIDIVRPAESDAGPQGAGDHRPEPVLHVARPRQRDASTSTRRRRACSTSSRSSTTTTSSRAATRSSPRRPSAPRSRPAARCTAGPGDVAGFKAVIDWLRGRVPGYDATATPVTANWDNGKNAMIGKSYDGTFANGVASTGVEGLTTIVPISAISDWYDYSRMGGIRFNTHYPASLSSTITQNVGASQLGVVPPNRNALVRRVAHRDERAPTATRDGDVNQFWQDRNYNLNVDNVKRVGLRVARPERRQRPAEPLLAVVGRPRREQRAAQALAVPGGPRRPVRLPPRRLGRHAAPLVRLLAPGRRQQDHERAAGGHRDRPEHVGDARRAGRCPTTKPVDVYLHGTAAGAPGELGLELAAAARLADVHGREPERDQLPQPHQLAGEQADCSCRRRSRTTCASRARRWSTSRRR